MRTKSGKLQGANRGSPEKGENKGVFHSRTPGRSEEPVRIKGDGHAIYLHPEVPFWFVPNPLGDEILRLRMNGETTDQLGGMIRKYTGGSPESCALDVESFLRSVEPPPARTYSGRKNLSLNRLSEIWLHVTDVCNLRCRHCLFRTCQGSGRSLEVDRAKAVVEETERLGCRLVCITGGEPFTHPGFLDLVEWVLGKGDFRVAVLTNGTLIPDNMRTLERFDRERIHFQVSLDGSEPVHDALRGRGCFQKTLKALDALVGKGIPCSVAMAVNAESVTAMEACIRTAHDRGIGTVHFLWHFVRGLGVQMDRVRLNALIERFRAACSLARSLGIDIDNLEAMRAQVFSPVGTRYDLGNAGWESLAVGPDGAVYPTPAMVDMDDFRAGLVTQGLEHVWTQSEILQQIRSLSLTEVPEMNRDPWKFIIGGGDLDHCCVHEDGQKDLSLLGQDPYAPLYREMARMLILDEADSLPVPQGPGRILCMGEVTTDCPTGQEVNFTHSNCLLSVGEGTTKGLVRSFYEDRARSPDEAILNPVTYEENRIDYIPQEARVRLYGCGSPVTDADLSPGEVVVDLGSGTGVEIFIAAKEVGYRGMAIGIDMTDAMLDIACRSRGAVQDALGYDNTIFLKGYLEAIPLADETADAVVSNCVVNLNHHKRRVFQEIFRVLKPGGRLVISDVVTETEPGVSIRADHRLIGECIGGAMVQETLFYLLAELGFVNASIVKRFPYRTVQGHSFHSITFCARKPIDAKKVEACDVVYAGPFRSVVTDNGFTLHKGVRTRVPLNSWLDRSRLADAGVLVLDSSSGAVTNSDAAPNCACFTLPGEGDKKQDHHVPDTGCHLCGEPLIYLDRDQNKVCAKCGKEKRANAVCYRGHFICDACHVQDPKELIRRVCSTTIETDMIRLLQEIRSHACIPMHGPEHHAIVPGIILATYRNLGGNVTEDEIFAGIERGALIPGGSCAFMGACGAAVGVGIAFSIILGSNPLTPGPRQNVQGVVSAVISRLAGHRAARCCQRDCFLVLREAARLSRDYLSLSLKAGEQIPCTQHEENTECIKSGCPLYPVIPREIQTIILQ